MNFSAMIRGGRQDSVMTALSEYRRLGPGDKARRLAFIAGALNTRRELDRAWDTVHELLREFPGDGEVLEQAGRLSINRGEVHTIIPLIQSAYEAAPHDVARAIQLSYYLCHTGNHTASRALLEPFAGRGNPVVEFHLGWHEMKAGRMSEGLRRIAIGREIWRWGAYDLGFDTPPWSGEELQYGTPLYVVFEGGVGDHLAALGLMRTLAARTAARPIYVTQPKLLALTHRTLKSDDVLALPELDPKKIRHWVAAFNGYACIGSDKLPFPTGAYLVPEPNRCSLWDARLRTLRKQFDRVVGLRLSGQSGHEMERYRQLDPADAEAFCRERPKTAFLLLYPEPEKVPAMSAANVIDVSRYLRDWEDTLAAMSGLDAVISSCTSVAHASAGLGKKTFVLSQACPYFVFTQPGETSQWYGDHVRVLHQTQSHDWSPVWRRLRELI